MLRLCAETWDSSLNSLRKAKVDMVEHHNACDESTMSSQGRLDPALVREFVIAGHGNLWKVQELLGLNPELLNVAYQVV